MRVDDNAIRSIQVGDLGGALRKVVDLLRAAINSLLRKHVRCSPAGYAFLEIMNGGAGSWVLSLTGLEVVKACVHQKADDFCVDDLGKVEGVKIF